MKKTQVERSYDLCAEGGWYGYYIHFDAPVEDAFIAALATKGSLLWMKNMSPAFFTLRTQRFLLRGLAGDCFVKVGVEGNDPALLQEILAWLP